MFQAHTSGNVQFDFINRRIQELHGGVRQSTQAQMDELRQRLARPYDRLDPDEKRRTLLQFRIRRRAQQLAGRIARDARAADGFEQPMATSHLGAGTTHSPLATSHVQDALGSQGCITYVAEKVWPEDEVVIPPAARRLRLPPGARDDCERKHFGFCKTRDADIADRVACVHHHLAKHATPRVAGQLVVRFDPLLGADTPHRAFDVHVTFASLRQDPKCCAMFAQGVPCL